MIHMIKEHMSLAQPSYDPDFFKRISLAASFETAGKLGQLYLLEEMLVDGIDVNERDSKGRTLLHWAAGNGHQEAVELLLRCAADPAIKDASGRTALELARRNKYKTIARLIEQRRGHSH